ncbi:MULTISPECIES: DUF6086 family protein [unclassified Streptomyces]|uniref:DUF6086 family protein n=1 Tax=unclassified Streptomyces TaxID=2593676 RepID=UPI003D755B88
MSCFFQVGDDDVWNPSNSLARAFLGQADALSQIIGRDPGLGEIIEDECEIDPAAFPEFVDALVKTYQDSNNEALKALLKGFVTVALVLVDRMGSQVMSINPEYADMWATEAETQAKSMPWG